MGSESEGEERRDYPLPPVFEKGKRVDWPQSIFIFATFLKKGRKEKRTRGRAVKTVPTRHRAVRSLAKLL
jgi:hypothetical protein